MQLPRKIYFRFFGLLFADTLVVTILGLLAAWHRFPPGPWPAVIILLLLAANVLVLRTLRFRQLAAPAPLPRGLATRLLIMPVLYTVMGVVLLISFLRHPTPSGGLQVSIGIVVLGGFWYIIRKMRRKIKDFNAPGVRPGAISDPKNATSGPPP